MAVVVITEHLLGNVEGHIEYVPETCSWLAILHPDLTPDGRDRVLRRLCAEVGETLDGATRLAS